MSERDSASPAAHHGGPPPPPPLARSKRRRGPVAWQHRGLRRLATAWMFTNLADSALYLMVAVWVKDLTGSDAAAGLVFAALGLPSVAAPFLGHLADRLSRRRLVVVSNLTVAATVATLFLVDSASWLPLVYLVVIVYGAAGTLNSAAQSGLVRDLLPDEHLASGNALLSTIDEALRLLSPLVGTGLYILAGPRAVIALTVVAFLIAAAVLAGLRLDESPPEPAPARGRYWAELGAGFAHLTRTSPLSRLTVLIAVAFSAVGLVNVAVFPVMEQGLGVPTSTLGLLVSVQGIGAVIGGLSAAAAIDRYGEHRIFAVGMATLALAITPLLGTSLAAALPGLAALGFGVTWAVVAFITLRQRLTPARLQGRVAGTTSVTINVPQTLLTALGAGLLAVVDYRLLVLTTVIVVLAAAIAAAPGSARQPAHHDNPGTDQLEKTPTSPPNP